MSSCGKAILIGEGDAGALSDFPVGIVFVIVLVIALITCLSIDSVGAISSMEGNALTSNDCSVACHCLVDEFKECDSASSLKKAVLAELNDGFREHGGTCADYANNLQHIVDHLLWFTCFRNTEGNEAELEDSSLISIACQQLASEDKESIFVKTNEYLAGAI